MRWLLDEMSEPEAVWLDWSIIQQSAVSSRAGDESMNRIAR